MKRIAAACLVAILGLALASCEDDGRLGNAKAYAPIPAKTVALMSEKGMTKSDPVLIRTFKKEAELEVWKKDRSGRYALLKTYPICRWSGQLGPKVREGDRQAPEGFYAITPAQMNPNSNYYLSFDTGYPNTFDRANGRNGSFLMVHGTCSSRGCYAMTDEQIAEIYAIMREAFSAGQRSIQMQAMPFHMNAENLAKHRRDPNIAFWKNLKQGVDHFQVTKLEPQVGVCGRHYVFDAQPADGGRLDPSAPCPALKVDQSLAASVAAKEKQDEAHIAELVQKGTPAIKLVYDDGGQNPVFRNSSYASGRDADTIQMAAVPSKLGDVSRPEALARGPQEVELDAGDKTKPVIAQNPAPAAAPTATATALVPLGAPAQSAETQVAKANSVQSSPAVVPVTASATEKPSFLSRVLSFDGLLSNDKPNQPAAAEPLAPQPVATPLPPRRQAGARKPQNSKPEAGIPARQTHAQIDGSAPMLGTQLASGSLSLR